MKSYSSLYAIGGMLIIATANVSPAMSGGTVPPGAEEHCPWRAANEPGICYIPIQHHPELDPAPQAGLPDRQAWCTDPSINISMGTDGRTNITTMQPICLLLSEYIDQTGARIMHSEYLRLVQISTSEQGPPAAQNGGIAPTDIVVDVDFKSSAGVKRIAMPSFQRACYQSDVSLAGNQNDANVGSPYSILADSSAGILHLWLGTSAARCS